MKRLLRPEIWLVIVAGAIVLFSADAPPLREVDLEGVKELYNARRALFIDARDFDRYRRGTIPGALNVPLKRFKRMRKWLPVRKDAKILVFCNGIECGKSAKLARKLTKEGYTDIQVFTEGFPLWKRRGLPIMAAPKPCRCGEGNYTPSRPATLEGVSLYLDPRESDRIDARWIAPLLEKGTIPRGLHLVDVRPQKQYERGHLKGAISIPFDPDSRRLAGELPKEGPILFVCNHGAISAEARDTLPDDLQKRILLFDGDIECKKEECKVFPR